MLVNRPAELMPSTRVTTCFFQSLFTLADGTTGFGEASTLGGPRWSEESVEAIKANIDTYIVPVLLDQPAQDFEANAQ